MCVSLLRTTCVYSMPLSSLAVWSQTYHGLSHLLPPHIPCAPQVINWLGQRLAEHPEGSEERVAALLDITQLDNAKLAGVLQGALGKPQLPKELANVGYQVGAWAGS
jgi:hypothetical protein